ncbi:hypothetical protein QJS04_geneDACA000403 [Acorus gramineus]|uniref:Mitochondrial carrier protein n=1 Tax=Acorus gramineus TaxID=55184 RepID=A0AAV9ASM2_ACOGR|nr:hypothetical protein QJS04_geneDACA000403 [Acorus gramineus]
MASQNHPTRGNKRLIKYTKIPLDASPHNPSTRSNSQSDRNPCRSILSTGSIISAVGTVWNSVNNPPQIFRTKENRRPDGLSVDDGLLCYADGRADDGSSSPVFERLKVIKASLFDLRRGCSGFSKLGRVGDFDASEESYRLYGGIGFSVLVYDLARIYGCARERLETIGKVECRTAIGESSDLDKNVDIREESMVREAAETSAMIDSVSKTSASGIDVGCHAKCLSSSNATVECRISGASQDVSGSEAECIAHEFVLEDEFSLSFPLLGTDKLRNIFAKNRHAISGALAGTFVSLCLHPVDTVKTVIQASKMEQKSAFHIFKRIVSERGLMGLYRGIASNIASSAPISAVYIFTYESVKAALLPQLPKEYLSIAHCTAGGCASVATSFIFTPSERIKQQMQVGFRYQTCWSAFVGILGKGGLPSLYTGWDAVLIRNIPHSIIKFYTYESLKHAILSSAPPDAHLNTLQTLACGGVAASTAALFTTPFDVVKTRLQTQVPGSLQQYRGVLHTLQEIATHEGLKGLYRGLCPRLVMYISQGAIFFASYEFFKRVFYLDVSQLPVSAVGNGQGVEGVPSS